MSFPSPSPWVSSKLWPAVIRHAPVQGVQGVADGQAALSPYAPAYQPRQVMPTAPAQNHFFAPLPTYPASNMPDMWNRLAPYIAQSATLRQQLAQLVQTGWVVEWNHRQGTSCELERRRIRIDVAYTETQVMQLLAHEVSHGFDTPVDARYHPSDASFALAKLRNEAVAVVNHLRVRSEIFQGCGRDIGISQRDPGYYENAVAFRQRHSQDERLLQHIQRLMAWDITSMHGRCYWEGFLNDWRSTRNWPPVSVPPNMIEEQRGQAWQALAAEMNAV